MERFLTMRNLLTPSWPSAAAPVVLKLGNLSEPPAKLHLHPRSRASKSLGVRPGIPSSWMLLRWFRCAAGSKNHSSHPSMVSTAPDLYIWHFTPPAKQTSSSSQSFQKTVWFGGKHVAAEARLAWVWIPALPLPGYGQVIQTYWAAIVSSAEPGWE